MGFVKQISDMATQGSIIGYVSLGIIAIFAFYVIWHAIRGYQRGGLKQIFHLGFVVIAVVISYYTTAFLWTQSLRVLDGQTVEGLLALFGVELPANISDALGAFDMQVLEYIMLLPVGVIVMPFVFMTVFFIVNIVLKLFYVITVGVLRVPYAENKSSEISGMLLGILEGILVAFMILLPVEDVVAISTDAYNMIEETRDERGLGETDGEKFLAEYAVPLSENPVLMFISAFGGEALLDGFSTFEDGVGVLNMREEFASMVKLTFLDFASLHDADWMQLAPHHKLAIDDIDASIENSRYKTEVLSETLSCIGHLVGAFNVDELSAKAKADIILALFSIFEDLEADELDDVLEVFKEFYFYMSDEGILKAYENGDNEALADLFTKLNSDGKSNLTVICEIFKKNERTAVLSTQLTQLSMSVLAGSVGMDAEAVQKYNDVKSKFGNALAELDTSKPKEEQVADMSNTITTSMAENGMTIEPAVADEMATYIVEKHGGKTELTNEEFDDALLYYYQAKKNSEEASGS